MALGLGHKQVGSRVDPTLIKFIKLDLGPTLMDLDLTWEMIQSRFY